MGNYGDFRNFVYSFAVFFPAERKFHQRDQNKYTIIILIEQEKNHAGGKQKKL